MMPRMVGARASEAARFGVGSVIDGQYRLDGTLGEGGMAVVYEATDLRSGRAVALKLLKSNVGRFAEAVERLRREGEALGRLRNPAIVGIERIGELPEGGIFLAMERLEGETLGARMRRQRFQPAELTPIVTGVAAGLAAAHRAGIVHRDFKPDNVFLSRRPGDGAEQVKILDFGISKVFGAERLTQTGQVLGTPRYMAPEQLAAERDLDAGVDVYALGVILYEALSGQSPFASGTPSDLIVAIVNGRITPLRAAAPQLPSECVEVVMRMMATAREARYASIVEAAEAWVAAAPASASATASEGGASSATVALGSMQRDPSEISSSGELQLGTFLDYQKASPAPATAPALSVGAMAGSAGPSASAPAASTPGQSPGRAPATSPAPRPEATPGAAPLAGPAAGPAHDVWADASPDESVVVVAGMGGGRSLKPLFALLGALVLGAAVAIGIVLAVRHARHANDAPAVATPAPSPAPSPAPAAPAVARPSVGTPPPAPEATPIAPDPTIATPPPEAIPAGAELPDIVEPPTVMRRRRRRRSASMSGGAPVPISGPTNGNGSSRRPPPPPPFVSNGQ